MAGERLSNNRVNGDVIDAVLAMNRQRIILEMANNGQLDPESAISLFEATTRPDPVAQDREAFEKNDFGPDSPSGCLGALFFKLKPQ